MTKTHQQLIWKRFRNHQLAFYASIVLLILCMLALAAGWIEALLGVSHDMADLSLINSPAGWPHLMGTNELGQDVFTRLLFGGRISLTVGVLSALTSALIGALIGLLAGFYGGVLDSVLMRFTDAMLSIPVLPLMIVFSAIDLKMIFGSESMMDGNWASVLKLILIIVFFGWMTVARLARAAAMQLKTLEFVTAARSLGATDIRLLWVHILPNSLAPIIVAATLEVGGNILYEASLSFLGLGIQPPVSSWGNMLNSAMDYMKTDPSLAFWPGFFILITVACFNFFGDGMRDALDPHRVMKH
ncbi:MAG: ABC transporter permease [Myxococcaceae bacterium]|nr:ABC transporter permease [Myxococcaceae bacterium]MBH2006596.1 ABC transporter permease [Myxococcaceae bacterium]